MKKFFPLIKNYRAVTLSRAFFINAVVLAIISALTIEVRMYVREKTFIYDNIDEYDRILLVIVTSLTIGITVYFLLHLLTGFGGGLIAPKKPAPFF